MSKLVDKHKNEVRWIFSFVVVSSCLLIVLGFFYMRSFQKEHKQHVERDIFAYVQMKDQSLMQWKNNLLIQMTDYFRNDRFRALFEKAAINQDDPQNWMKVSHTLKIESQKWKTNFYLFDQDFNFLAGSDSIYSIDNIKNAADLSSDYDLFFNENLIADSIGISFSLLVPFYPEVGDYYQLKRKYYVLLQSDANNVFKLKSEYNLLEETVLTTIFSDRTTSRIWTNNALNKNNQLVFSDAGNNHLLPVIQNPDKLHVIRSPEGEKFYAASAGMAEMDSYLGVMVPVRYFNFSLTRRLIVVLSALLLLLFILFAIFVLLKKQMQLKYQSKSIARDEFLEEIINTQPAGMYQFIEEKNVKSSQLLKKTNAFPKLKYNYVSQNFLTITGISKDDFVKDPSVIIQYLHEDDREQFIKKNRDAAINFKKFQYEGRIYFKDNLRWLRIESVPKRLNQNQVLWSGMIIDITEEKKMINEIAAREKIERLIGELSSDFVNISYSNFDDIVNSSLEKLGLFINVDRVYVFLWDKERNTISNTHEWYAKGVQPQKHILNKYPADNIPNVMKRIKSYKAVIINDVYALSDEWQKEKIVFERLGLKSLLILPVISKQSLIGFVGLDAVKIIRHWKNAEVKLLGIFADLFYNAIERKRYEVNLIESRKMLRTILDTINIRVFWKNRKLEFIGCNNAFAIDAGLENPEQIVGKSDLDMRWSESAQIFRNDDMQVIKSGKPKLNYVEMLPGVNKEDIWVRVSKIPIRNSDGEIFGVLGTYENITQQKLAEEKLKASEERYRKLTESAFDGIYMLDDNQFLYVNNRFLEVCGYDYHEIVNPDFNFWGFFTEESKEIVKERRRSRRMKSDVSSVYELQIVHKTGKIIDVEVSTTIISEGKNGNTGTVMGVMRDITERKINEVLRNQVSVANQTVIFKQNFLANMSHEIRTPLTGVIGMIDILAKTNLNEKQYDYVNTLKISADNLREIINQILDYSKIEAGRVKSKSEKIYTSSLFTNAKKLYSSICKKDIELQISIDSHLPAIIQADEHMINQVVNNLISNAVKFTYAGKIVLKAELYKTVSEDQVVIKLSVSDTGKGIEEKDIEKLFKPFEQIDNKDTRGFEGTGLGLSISKQLAIIMGGEIGVDSIPGKGSTFWFTFKANLGKEKVEEKESIYQEIINDEAIRPLNILLVEDKLVNQKVISLMLKSQGHKVDTALNGKEAIHNYQHKFHDLILMDIQMPVLDGISATQALREKYEQLPPIVGLSANAFEGDREKYMDQGLDEYLTKPVKSEDFKRILREIF